MRGEGEGEGEGHCKAQIDHLEVAVEPAVGVKMAERLRKEGKDLLGPCQVDPLLQQHGHEVAICCRHHDAKVELRALGAYLWELFLPLVGQARACTRADHRNDK